MKNVTKGLGAQLAGASAAALVGSQFFPTFALAVSGQDILIPKPAEFVPALIAFLVIWLIMAKFAWPQIIAALDARQKKIQDDIDAAEQSRKDAAEEKKRAEASMSEAEGEAAKIIQQAKHDAETERGRIIDKANQDAAAAMAKQRDAVEAERKRAMAELSGSVVDLSVEIASKIIGDNLAEDEQRKLAEKYLDEVSAEVGNDNESKA